MNLRDPTKNKKPTACSIDKRKRNSKTILLIFKSREKLKNKKTKAMKNRKAILRRVNFNSKLIIKNSKTACSKTYSAINPKISFSPNATRLSRSKRHATLSLVVMSSRSLINLIYQE